MMVLSSFPMTTAISVVIRNWANVELFQSGFQEKHIQERRSLHGMDHFLVLSFLLLTANAVTPQLSVVRDNRG